jgi:hypothetical protein
MQQIVAMVRQSQTIHVAPVPTFMIAMLALIEAHRYHGIVSFLSIRITKCEVPACATRTLENAGMSPWRPFGPGRGAEKPISTNK